jgi:hypothetical protein
VSEKEKCIIANSYRLQLNVLKFSGTSTGNCQSNIDNLNNARHEASRHFRNKKCEYLKAKINELETNNKNKNIRELHRGISYFKKGYQPRTKIVKDEKGDLVADSHGILVRWKSHFSKLLNVHGDNDVRQTEIHTYSRGTSAFEVEMMI